MKVWVLGDCYFIPLGSYKTLPKLITFLQKRFWLIQIFLHFTIFNNTFCVYFEHNHTVPVNSVSGCVTNKVDTRSNNYVRRRHYLLGRNFIPTPHHLFMPNCAQLLKHFQVCCLIMLLNCNYIIIVIWLLLTIAIAYILLKTNIHK